MKTTFLSQLEPGNYFIFFHKKIGCGDISEAWQFVRFVNGRVKVRKVVWRDSEWRQTEYVLMCDSMREVVRV